MSVARAQDAGPEPRHRLASPDPVCPAHRLLKLSEPRGRRGHLTDIRPPW